MSDLFTIFSNLVRDSILCKYGDNTVVYFESMEKHKMFLINHFPFNLKKKQYNIFIHDTTHMRA